MFVDVPHEAHHFPHFRLPQIREEKLAALDIIGPTSTATQTNIDKDSRICMPCMACNFIESTCSLARACTPRKSRFKEGFHLVRCLWSQLPPPFPNISLSVEPLHLGSVSYHTSADHLHGSGALRGLRERRQVRFCVADPDRSGHGRRGNKVKRWSATVGRRFEVVPGV